MTRRFCTALVATLAALGSSSAAGAADMALKDLIDKVRAAETLYADLDVSLEMVYESRPAIRSAGIVQNQTCRTRCVLQQGMMNLTAEARYKTEGYDGGSYERLCVYDGNQSKIRQGHTVNIIDGPTVDEHIFRPHMVLLQDLSYPVPLSTYMQGEQALLAYPGKVFTLTTRRVECVSLGEDEVDGHPCFKVALRHIGTGSGKLWDQFILWLAVDRNYLPIRCVGYAYKWSSELPYNEGKVLEFDETSPGVWFPMKTLTTMYDHRTLKDKNEQVIKATRRYQILQVSLKPDHPLEFFRDLAIPDHSTVYRVDALGEIIESYRTGGP